MSPAASAVVVDTSVYGAPLQAEHSRKQAERERLYARHLLGRPVVLAAQTVAELRYGARKAGWGHQRRAELEQHLDEAIFAPVDKIMTSGFAQIRTACFRNRHPLASKEHVGDLWIATTALSYGLPLVAHDKIFRDVLWLELITELAD